MNAAVISFPFLSPAASADVSNGVIVAAIVAFLVYAFIISTTRI